MSEHDPVYCERLNRPLTNYVMCDECGRTENTVEELNKRPCEDGISPKE